MITVKNFYKCDQSYKRHLRFFASNVGLTDVNNVADANESDDENIHANDDGMMGSDNEDDDIEIEDADGGALDESESNPGDTLDAGPYGDGWHNTYTAAADSTPQFLGDHGPCVILPPTATEIDFFSLLFPEHLWTIMLTETVRYARQNDKTFSEIPSIPELKAFIGLIMAMSIHKLPRIENYWSSHWVLSVPQFMQIMPVKRFWQLWSNIHMNDNEKAKPKGDLGHDTLFKVRPLIDVLSRTFSECYSPAQELSVDESMVKYKGRNRLKQFLPMKPIKRGFKIWCCSCSSCGYLCSFQVYIGKVPGDEKKGLAHRVVLDLTSDLHHKNHIVFMDNFFTSLPLADDLESNGTYFCGTFRCNRVGFPTAFKGKNPNTESLRGAYTLLHKDKKSACKWKDSKWVFVCSNAYPPTNESHQVLRRLSDGNKVPIQCPEMVKTYNKHMGGVDQLDQSKQVYGFNRKSKRWWLRLFFNFIDLAVVNSFIVYKQTYDHNWHPPLRYKCKDQLTFRVELIDQLVNHFSSRKQHGRPVSVPIISLVPSGHKIVDMTSMIGRGRCDYCTKGNGKAKRKRKETKFGCPKCVKRLCPETCWEKFHHNLLPAHDE